LLKLIRKAPEAAGAEIGNFLKGTVAEIQSYNVVKGYLNFELSKNYWLLVFKRVITAKNFGRKEKTSNPKTVLVEFSSPNTNKPLHLGHIRNNLLGHSMSEILDAAGNRVVRVNIVNDRGIHICKSMLAWQKWGKGITPESTGKKGDHLVGDFYVMFEQELKKQVEELIHPGESLEEARAKAPLMVEAQEMLRKWEAGDPETVSLWKMMNQWVYDGFDVTYDALGVWFDKIYYESETFKLGRTIVLDALAKKILTKKPDGSVWADLTSDGLDEKILLRADGTAVYMTQDLGTAVLRYNEYEFHKHIYVVGNEQNYHFQVLALILSKIGYPWAKDLYHLSYGMVELPFGKMKSREGTVVDADDLIEEMITTAREMSKELGKLDGYQPEEKEKIYRMIGLGALKYFILKVDPKKNMTFNPEESIDFNGNTGPFIQYTYTRIQSILRKAGEAGILDDCLLNVEADPPAKEIELIKLLEEFPHVVEESAEMYNPGLIANFCYEVAREYNQFYHDYPIIKEQDKDTRNLRIILSETTGNILYSAMDMLGIEMPDRM
jgi:arginyl-tRNA synthetase